MIYTKRVYDPPSSLDGKRFLVDRLWPRGIKKEQIILDGWLKDVAPSETLRRNFSHKVAKWEEFVHNYALELDGKASAWKPIFDAARSGDVILLFAAKDREHNNAVALKFYLDRQLSIYNLREENQANT